MMANRNEAHSQSRNWFRLQGRFLFIGPNNFSFKNFNQSRQIMRKVCFDFEVCFEISQSHDHIMLHNLGMSRHNGGSLVWKERTAWAVYIFRAGSCKI